MEEYMVKEVNIVDIKMPFWSMVTFMVKATIAAIPAMIILSILASMFTLLFGGMLSVQVQYSFVIIRYRLLSSESGHKGYQSIFITLLIQLIIFPVFGTFNGCL